ncbi:unnamed protein product, partial [marine sediment metagenome]
YSYTVQSGATINATYYSMEGMDANGLNLNSGAIITDIDNCNFDNNGTSTPAVDSHMTIDAAQITSNLTQAGCTFDDTNTFTDYNITLTGTPGANYWTFSPSYGDLGGGLGEANDNDDGDPGMIRWPTEINIEGTCDQYNQTDDCTDDGPEVIAVAIDGVLQGETDTTVDGSWQITGVTTPAPGAIITVFVDGEATANQR